MSWNNGRFGRKGEDNRTKIEEAIASNDWNVRQVGYGGASTEFRKPDLHGKNWDLFHQLVKILTAERNVPAMEKGLDAVLSFMENCSIVDDEVVKSLLTSVVKKGLADVKPRIKELANKICMALFDRKKHEMVVEMLLQGMETKNAKNVLCCVRTLTNALIVYGPTYVNIPAVATKAVTLCQDKAMFQQDIKALFKEMYKWVGPDGMECYLKALDLSQRKALAVEFSKVEVDDTRVFLKPPMSVDSYDSSQAYLETRPRSARQPMEFSQLAMKNVRPSSTSQALKKAERVSSTQSRQHSSAVSTRKAPERACGDRPKRYQSRVTNKLELDDIFIMMESKLWGDRKEAVDELYNRIESNVTINSVDYGKIIKRLRVLILEDTNVVLVSKAIKCVSALAKSQNKEFQQHVPLMMTLLLEKFKEKKSIVVDSTREAIDATYYNYSFGGIARYVALSLLNSNPSVKAETAFFVQRCYTRPTPALLKASHWQPLVQGLISNLTFPDQNVRENAMNALGTMLKALGEKLLAPYLSKVPKHQITLILKYSYNVQVSFGRSSSRSEATTEGDTGSGSEELTSTSTNADETIQSNVTALLPGFKTRASANQGPNRQSNHNNTGVRTQNSSRINQVYSSNESEDSFVTQANYRNSLENGMNATNKKALSPAAKQKLETFRSVINQLKDAWRNVHPSRPSHMGSVDDNCRSIEEKITKKLQDLEGNVYKCFSEIRLLMPQLYAELEYSNNESSGDVIRTLNLRLCEMERLLKSMAFETCPPIDTSNV